MSLVRPWWSVALAAVALGCGSDNPEVTPTPHSIEIRPGGPLTMRQGDTTGLGIIVRDRTGAGIFHGPITCRSSAHNVATAAATSPDACQLAAVGAGTAIIQAEIEGVVGALTVTVMMWPRGEVSGGAHGVVARWGVAMVTTLDGHVDRIDPASGAVQAQYDFSSPYVALSADATHAYFGNVRFDLASGTQTGVLVTDVSSCDQIAAAVERPQGSAIYLSCGAGVVVASSSTADILATIPTAARVTSFALDPTGQHLYGTAFSDARVYEISTATNTLTRDLQILGGPQASVLPGDNQLYESMESERQIERWDLSGPALADSVPILKPLGFFSGPFDLALSADGTRLLTSAGPYVVEVDRSAFTVSKTYWVGGNSRRIAVSGGTALVANENGWVDVLPF